MGSHRRRSTASSDGHGLAGPMILVLVAVAGAGVYLLMRPASEESPRVTTSGSASPSSSPTRSPTPAVEPATRAIPAVYAPTPGAGRPSAVEEQYDERHDRFKVLARGIFLEESVSESWKLEVSWTNPGPTRQRPTTPIAWILVHQGPKPAHRKDDPIDLRLDGVPVAVDAVSYAAEKSGMETMRFTTDLNDFLAVGGVKKVTLQVGAKEWDLAGEPIESLRALASYVPN